MSSVVIDIGKDYSRYPAGRFREDGPFSGERFREERLLGLFQAGSKVQVLLDGTAGYGSSFLEEAFGGLVRRGIPHKVLEENLKLVTEDAALNEEIWTYIRDEVRRSQNGK
jgi:hypothetical protein